jgi:hypothetical protein
MIIKPTNTNRTGSSASARSDQKVLLNRISFLIHMAVIFWKKLACCIFAME